MIISPCIYICRGNANLSAYIQTALISEYDPLVVKKVLPILGFTRRLCIVVIFLNFLGLGLFTFTAASSICFALSIGGIIWFVRILLG